MSQSIVTTENEIHVFDEYAEIREIKNLDKPAKGMIRIWCFQYPNIFNIQIRSNNPLNGRHQNGKNNGKNRDFIATACVTYEDFKAIISKVEYFREHQSMFKPGD